MDRFEADHILKSGVTCDLIVRMLNKADRGDVLSLHCALFTRGDVREFLLLIFSEHEGFIKPDSILGKAAVWALVEFG